MRVLAVVCLCVCVCMKGSSPTRCYTVDGAWQCAVRSHLSVPKIGPRQLCSQRDLQAKYREGVGHPEPEDVSSLSQNKLLQ